MPESYKGWTLCASGGTGYFAPTPFTEETEVAGLSLVQSIGGLSEERATSAAIDMGGAIAGVEVNAGQEDLGPASLHLADRKSEAFPRGSE